jgi:hypothetical protein
LLALRKDGAVMTALEILRAALEEIRYMATFSMTTNVGLAGAGLWSKANAALEAAAKAACVSCRGTGRCNFCGDCHGTCHACMGTGDRK